MCVYCVREGGQGAHYPCYNRDTLPHNCTILNLCSPTTQDCPLLLSWNFKVTTYFRFLGTERLLRKNFIFAYLVTLGSFLWTYPNYSIRLLVFFFWARRNNYLHVFNRILLYLSWNCLALGSWIFNSVSKTIDNGFWAFGSLSFRIPPPPKKQVGKI